MVTLSVRRSPADASVMPLSPGMPVYESSRWSIELAPGWRATEDAECVTFCREDGVGALQISAYRHDSGKVPVDDLRDFTKDEYPEGVTLQPASCGTFIGSGIEYVADCKFWLKRWLHSGPLLLYVSYNSNVQHRAVEMDEVNQMIATLRIL
jgi:hypothetical protein